jgi:SAM-dependent methyltransferase
MDISGKNNQSTSTANQVLEFYRELPFNITGDPKSMAAEIRAFNSVSEYPPLTRILNPRARILDIGCGAGWLSNSIAHYYKAWVQGIDFNPVAVDFAKSVAEALGTNATFAQADIFTYVPDRQFDIAVSLGVLHHTPDCMGALRRICVEIVRPGGLVFVGLYHSHGRRPFLEHFAEMRKRGADEASLFDEFSRLIGDQPIDSKHLTSWFRDQVLHPHESQHTLAECIEVLRSSKMQLLTSSIDGYVRTDNPESAVSRENALEDEGRKWLDQGRYFPGFFCFLARRTG